MNEFSGVSSTEKDNQGKYIMKLALIKQAEIMRETASVGCSLEEIPRLNANSLYVFHLKHKI